MIVLSGEPHGFIWYRMLTLGAPEETVVPFRNVSIFYKNDPDVVFLKSKLSEGPQLFTFRFNGFELTGVAQMAIAWGEDESYTAIYGSVPFESGAMQEVIMSQFDKAYPKLWENPYPTMQELYNNMGA